MTNLNRSALLCLAVLVSLHLASPSAQALDPNVPPGQNFDLTHWYLGLPVDSSGGTSGDSASISAAQLVAGYSNALYFYTGADGAMTFWAPVTGATTPGSSYPRSELREQISPPSNDINWSGYGFHILNATCKVTQVPDTKKVIIGQIHTKTGDARPLVKLQYNNGTIEALVKVYASDTMPNTDNKLTFQNVGLNNAINYTIQNENGLVTVTVNGLTKSTNTFLTDPTWADQGFYFKAGSYCQDNSGTSSVGARVAFYLLTRGHAPSITNQPVSLATSAGSTASFTVEAAGNGALQYQWRRYGTNLSSATASVLNLPNVQVSQSGDYSVQVTDSLGAVTSVVATLTVTNAVANTPPAFTSDPIIKPNATVGVAYSGSLAGDATDPDAGELLTFNKVGGPGWLNVATNGTLSGTPAAGDLGTNSWTVSVTDLASASNLATLNITVSAAPVGATVTNLIVDDSFVDGDRANTGPLQADWWSSSSTSGNSVDVSVGMMGMITGTSGRGLHGTFAPQTLGVGDTLTATYTFITPGTVGSNLGSPFRVALMDFNNPGLAADLSSSSSSVNPLYVGQPGYMSDFDVNTGATADVSIRKHDVTSGLGRFLGTTSEWIDQSTSPDNGYVFLPNTEYVGVFSVTRTGADSVDIFSSISQGATLLDSHTKSDLSGIANNFGMLGFWANSNTFGSNTTPGDPDNGIKFSNIKVEVITPSTEAPTLNISLAGGSAVLSWTTNGTAGFALQSATNCTPPIVWIAAGAPTVVGDKNHVTNSLTGNEKYYRLKKP